MFYFFLFFQAERGIKISKKYGHVAIVGASSGRGSSKPVEVANLNKCFARIKTARGGEGAKYKVENRTLKGIHKLLANWSDSKVPRKNVSELT